jgi:GT2 family glycosyltransferase
MNYKLSICLPAHRTFLWERLYHSIQQSVGEDYSWELVMVGPNEPPPFFADKANFKFFKDYGSPSRAFQISIMLAEGELVTWASDDGFYTKDSLKLCIEKHEKENLGHKDIVIVRHVEGRNHGGHQEPNDFWRAWHHPPLRLSGIPQDFYIILNGMMKLDYLRDLGGFDCIYENYNMNLHDLAFRAQRAGSKMYFSPTTCLNCDWNPNEGDHVPITSAHNEHDMPLFTKLMSEPQEDRIKIDIFNWTKSAPVWKRRFGDKK